jgi:hypothetical protein
MSYQRSPKIPLKTDQEHLKEYNGSGYLATYAGQAAYAMS